VNQSPETDRVLREAVLNRLHRAWQEEGLYRGVASRKDLAADLDVHPQALERNLEYLLERGFIRMHKIEDLVSITPDGIDRVETGGGQAQAARIEAVLIQLEQILQRIARRLDA
jgi:DNA-binding MarR family transcriptional regulator